MRQTQATTHTAKKNYKNNNHPQHYVKQKYTNHSTKIILLFTFVSLEPFTYTTH